MRFHTSTILVLGVLACAPLGGCASTNDNDPYNDGLVDIGATLTVGARSDTGNVTAGQAIPLEIDARDVDLVDPASGDPPAGQAARAGHIRVYMDDPSGAAAMITAQRRFDFTVPLLTRPGQHRVILRVHTHDGRATSTNAALDITVRPAAATGER